MLQRWHRGLHGYVIAVSLVLNFISIALLILTIYRLLRIGGYAREKKVYILSLSLAILSLALGIETMVLGFGAYGYFTGSYHSARFHWIISALFYSPHIVLYPMSYLLLTVAYFIDFKPENSRYSLGSLALFLADRDMPLLWTICEIISATALALLLVMAVKRKAFTYIAMAFLLLLISHLMLVVPSPILYLYSAFVRSVAFITLMCGIWFVKAGGNAEKEI